MPHTFLYPSITRSFASTWREVTRCFEAVVRVSNPRQLPGDHFGRRGVETKTLWNVSVAAEIKKYAALGNPACGSSRLQGGLLFRPWQLPRRFLRPIPHLVAAAPLLQPLMAAFITVPRWAR